MASRRFSLDAQIGGGTASDGCAVTHRPGKVFSRFSLTGFGRTDIDELWFGNDITECIRCGAVRPRPSPRLNIEPLSEKTGAPFLHPHTRLPGLFPPFPRKRGLSLTSGDV
ncbi:hypothetical protein LCGC14_1705020 [marine sediment metagenome]|uniref:Uncharacterized protein n=1 Tax=marine sediment metagenome TaxID=412755 RepID=A0A0F9HGJ4_9ZZZZ